MIRKNFQNTMVVQRGGKLSFDIIIVFLLLIFSSSSLFSKNYSPEELKLRETVTDKNQEIVSGKEYIYVTEGSIISVETYKKNKSKNFVSRKIVKSTIKNQKRKNSLDYSKKTEHQSSAKSTKVYLPSLPAKKFWFGNDSSFLIIVDISSFQLKIINVAITINNKVSFISDILHKDNFSIYNKISFWKFSVKHTSRPPPKYLQS